jgi:hypothetical protein
MDKLRQELVMRMKTKMKNYEVLMLEKVVMLIFLYSTLRNQPRFTMSKF